MLIEKIKKEFSPGEPILTREILCLAQEYTKAYVFRLISEAEEKGELVRFDQGVYYLPSRGGFFDPGAEDVARKKYISNKGNVYGIYGGLTLQNMFALTSQVPMKVEVITNLESARCREVEIGGVRFILRKSRVNITKENARAYTVLQLLSEVKDVAERFFDAGVRARILAYLREGKVSAEQLFSLVKAFPARTAKNLIRSNIAYEIA